MLVAPAATPPAIVDTLHADLKAIVAAPDTQQKLVVFGVIPINSPPVPKLQTFVNPRSGAGGRWWNTPASPARNSARASAP